MTLRRRDLPFDENTPLDETSQRTVRRRDRLRRVLERRQPDLHLLLENVHDPHNVSAVLRTCDAVGVGTVHLLYTNEAFPKLGHGASAGIAKWTNVVRHSSIASAIEHLHSIDARVLTTKLASDTESIYQSNFTGRLALCFGNEHRGISDELAEAADGNLVIPMVGLVESLNISVACAVALFEVYRQREAEGLYERPRMDSTEIDEMLTLWLRQ